MARKSVEERFWSKVEKTDTCWNWTGYKTKGYGRFSLMREGVQTFPVAHRFSYEHFVGEIPEGMLLDHMCYNRACVNPDHLRVVTCKQNNEHRKKQKNNTTGASGIYWCKRKSRFRAQVRHNGRYYYAGIFTDIEAAELAVKAKRNELFTHNDLDRVA